MEVIMMIFAVFIVFAIFAIDYHFCKIRDAIDDIKNLITLKNNDTEEGK